MMKQKNTKFDVNFHSQHWPLKCCHYALMVTSYRKWVQVLYPELTLDSIDLE